LVQTLPKFGMITGEVVGNVDGGSMQPVDIGTQGAVEVTLVDVDGNALPTNTPGYVEATVTRTGNDYTVAGPAGYYRISVSHPQFQPLADPGIPSDEFTVAPPGSAPVPSTVLGVFQLVNDGTNTPDPFSLEIIRGNLDISVFRTLSPSTTPVTTAQFTLTPAINPFNSGTITNGSLIGDLYPGNYQLQIREFGPGGPGDEIAFPVITNIVISRANIVTSAPSTTTVVAPLPLLAPSIVGSILGQNSNGGIVALPADVAAYIVTGNFDEPAINGAPIVADPLPGSSDAEITTAGAATGTVRYTFSNVPVGSHQVTLAKPTGSTPATASLAGFTVFGDAAKPLAVLDPGTNIGPNFVLRVENVELQVKLTTGDYPDIDGTITLQSPTGTTYTNGVFDEDTDVITFANVAPGLGNYQLSFTDALHANFNEPILVAPDLVAPYITAVSVTTVGDKGRLEGTSTQRDGPSGTSPLAAGATITVTGGTDCSPAVAPLCIKTVGAGSTMGEYAFDLAGGSYSVATELDGYVQSSPDVVSVIAGRIVEQNVQISKLATFIVTVKSPDGGDADTLPDPSPIGTTVELFDNSSPATYYTGTIAGDVHTFRVEPGRSYRVRVSAPGFTQVLLPSPTTYDTPVIGAQLSRPVTLSSRTINVTVNGGSPPAGTKVTARFDSDFVDAAAPFSFSSAVTTTLPTNAAGLLLVEAPGYRTVRSTISAPTAGVTTQTIPVTILPLVEATGTIKAPVGGTVSATSDGVTKVATIVTDPPAPAVDDDPTTNRFTFSGTNRLDVGPEGAPREWLIEYDVPGQGIATASVTVTGTSSSTPSVPLAVEVQRIEVTFDVQSAAPNGAVTIDFNGAQRVATPTVANTAVSTAVIEIPETLIGSTLTYTVTGTGYVVHGGGLVSPTSRAPISLPVTVVSRAISGTVTSAEPVPVGTLVRLCPVPTPPDPPAPVPPPTICNNGGAIASASTAVGGGFTISTAIAAGDYHLWARSTTGAPPVTLSGYVPITINADRSHTPASPSIPIS
jgi:hypothetical protein